MPPNTVIPLIGSAGAAGFVAEGAPLPVTRFDVSVATLGSTRIGAIGVFGRELLRSTDDRAASLFERHLAKLIGEAEDSALLSESAAVAFERPAGLLHNVAPIAAGSPGGLAADILDLWDSVASGNADRPFFITCGRGAVYLSTLRTSDDASMFPNVSPLGTGSILGVPQLVSSASEGKLILLDASRLAIFDGGAEAPASAASALQMDDAPTTAAADLVSMFQTNLMGIKILRYLDWSLGGDDAIACINLPLGSPA